MARTKKEIEEQASAAEPETTGTESNLIPQTDPETPPGEVANAGMTDLELAAANTLDPDAPQTDPEWNPDGQSEPGEEGFSPQTDLESADSDTGSHTDLESAETPGDGRPLMPSRRPVPKLSWKWNWLMITRPRLRGMTRLKETPSRLPPPGAARLP